MWGFIVALISGALMSIQGVFNTLLQSVLWPGFSQDGKVWLHFGRWIINIHFLVV